MFLYDLLEIARYVLLFKILQVLESPDLNIELQQMSREITCEEKKSEKEFFFKSSKDGFMQNCLGPSVE